MIQVSSRPVCGAAQPAITALKAEHDAAVIALKADHEKALKDIAKGQPKGSAGERRFVPLPENKAASESDDGLSACDRWAAAKAALVAKGMRSQDAVQKLVRDQPELHKQYLEEFQLVRN